MKSRYSIWKRWACLWRMTGLEGSTAEDTMTHSMEGCQQVWKITEKCCDHSRTGESFLWSNKLKDMEPQAQNDSDEIFVSLRVCARLEIHACCSECSCTQPQQLICLACCMHAIFMKAGFDEQQNHLFEHRQDAEEREELMKSSVTASDWMDQGYNCQTDWVSVRRPQSRVLGDHYGSSQTK